MDSSTRKMKNYVIKEYAGLAAHYDRRWAFFNKATLRGTLERLALKKNERLLDIGCGTGSLLQEIYRQYPSVELAGVDISREMLEMARTKLNRRVQLQVAEARHLPFRNDIFDIVVSCNSLHYWQKPEEALSEIARVLKPQGRVVITDWCHDYISCRIFDFCLSIFNRAHFKTYGQDRCKRLLRKAGFSSIVVERYKIDLLWGIMTATARQ